MKRTVLPFLALVFCLQQIKAQISIPASGIVSENFNAIGSSATASLPGGWQMSAAGAGATANWNSIGNITATSQAANSGSPTTGGAYNWATTAGTDRSIGFMTSGTYSSSNSILAFYQNTTGATINSLTINFQIERYRINTSGFYLNFSSSTDGTSWTAQPGGNISTAVFTAGSSNYDFSTPLTVYKTVTITGLNIINNASFYLRWVFNTPTSTNSQGQSLDNVSLNVDTNNPVINASLSDGLTASQKVKQGDLFTYTATISNKGKDATSVQYTAPLDANTTLNGSVKSSAIATDDSYTTALNTLLSGQNVLTNDFGLPTKTVLSFGPTETPSATTAGSTGTSDNGGIVVVNSDGSFTYTPPAGFDGYDRFAYMTHAGVAPDDAAIVTIAVGTIPSAGTPETFPGIIGNVAVTNATALLSNDAGSNPLIGAVNGDISLVGVATTTPHGDLTVNQDGTFIYNPAPGYTGTDQFTYSIDNGFSSPVAVTVNLTIAGKIWFINNNYTGTVADGRLITPFKSVSAFQATNNGTSGHPASGDIVFIYTGGSTYSAASLTLLSNQKLIGQGATATLSSITGLTPATYSEPFPLTNLSYPVIDGTGTALILGSNNEIRGISFGNTTATTITGSSFGTFTASETSINNTGSSGALDLTSGTLAAVFSDITSTGTSTNGIHLSNVAGTLIVNGGTISGKTGAPFDMAAGGTLSATINASISQANNAPLVSVAGGHSGSLTFQAGTINATNGTGLQFNNADGTYRFNGTTTLNGGSSGINIINGSGGNFIFGSSTSITNPADTAFNVWSGTASITYAGSISQSNNFPAISVSQGHTTGTITFNTGTISANNGSGLQFDNADGTYNFNGTTTLNGGDAGIDILNASGGTFSFTSGTSITNPSNEVLKINASSAAVSYNGSFTKNNNAINGILINSETGGTIDINGSGTKTLNTSTANAINITNNSSSTTINFSGSNLSLTTTSGLGFNATGGGIISVAGTGNIISSTTGTPLNVSGSVVNANGLHFQSISSNGALNGIVLNIPGSSGGLFVTGTGSGTTGGNILSSTGAGINLTSVPGVALSYMNISSGGDDGIRGSSVTNMTLANCTVSNNGNATTERGVDILNLLGNCSVNNCSFSGNAEDNFYIVNNTGTLSALNITGSSFSNTSTTVGNDGIQFRGEVGSPHMTMTVSNCTFSHNRGDHIQVTTDASNTAVMSATIQNNTFSGDRGTTYGGTDLGACITINTGGAADVTYDVENNNIQGAVSSAITINSSNTSILHGTLNSNTIGTAGTTDSGSSQGDGINIAANHSSAIRVTITNNIIRQYSNLAGINIAQRSGSATVQATVTGNTISNGGTFAAQAIFVAAGAATGDNGTMCLDLGGAGALANSFAGAGANGSTDFRVRQRLLTTVHLPGYAGANNNDAAVISFIQGRNTGSPSGAADNNVAGGGGGFVGGAACSQ
jgi:hypothetical protein